MGMTMTQKILAAHAGLPSVKAGDLIEAKLDLVLGNDVTTPVAVKVFEETGFTEIFDKEKIAILLDHYTPCKDIKSAQLCKTSREFAKRFSITHFYDVGQVGIEHALLPEKGLVAPGEVIIGAGENWFKVPAGIRVELTGKPGKWVSGKDVILHLIGKIGVDGALYRSLEFTGPGVAELSMDDRFTIANMAIEAGAKNGIFPVDEKTRAYVNGRVTRAWTAYEADPDAEYESTVEIDLSTLQPTVSLPHLPSNTRLIDEVKGMAIDQVVIGSCTNGRISDMRSAAKLLKGRKVAPGIRCIVIPATQEISLQCLREGLTEIFLEAGCVFSVPTCGPCLGGHMGCLAEGERAVSTTNRNFVGRMGHTKSEVILASPAVAAASAVKGCLASPADLYEEE